MFGLEVGDIDLRNHCFYYNGFISVTVRAGNTYNYSV